MRSDASWIRQLMLLGLAAALAGCGGGGNNPPPPAISISVSPAAVTVLSGDTLAFAANVSGSGNTAVNWSVQEAGGGTINSDGVYTAPLTAGTFHVVAISQADSSKRAVATITVPPITVAIVPDAVNMFFGATQNFTAVVTGAINTAVSWSVQEVGGGGITSAGAYTAPVSAGTFHLIAASQADPMKTATATIIVSDPTPAISVSPLTDTLGPNGERAFAATVAGNVAVSWSVQEGPAAGTVTQAGVYVAPAAPGTYHVVATRVDAPTVSAVATVTVVNSGFTRTGRMTTARYAHTATLLPDGRVLIVGGSETYQVSGLDSAELYDPATGTFTATGNLTARRLSHTATLLPNGKVLVAGGYRGQGVTLSSAELYDPAAGIFSPTGDMSVPRFYHTATPLPDGRVLIAGGEMSTDERFETAEIYDPATGSFQPTGSMSFDRFGHTATRLPNGKVLVVGGISNLAGGLVGAELYDPATGSFIPTGTMGVNRAHHSATLLSDGRVLVVAGYNNFDFPENSAEIYDPGSGTFTFTTSCQQAGLFSPSALLSDGTVLFAGGSLRVQDEIDHHFESVFTASLFDPETGAVRATGGLADPRGVATATRLQNGKVLVTGGLDKSGQQPLATAEIYH